MLRAGSRRLLHWPWGSLTRTASVQPSGDTANHQLISNALVELVAVNVTGIPASPRMNEFDLHLTPH